MKRKKKPLRKKRKPVKRKAVKSDTYPVKILPVVERPQGLLPLSEKLQLAFYKGCIVPAPIEPYPDWVMEKFSNGDITWPKTKFQSWFSKFFGGKYQ